MIDRDAIQPGAPGRFAAERVHFAEGLEKDVVGGVFGFLGIAKEPEGEVVDGAIVFGVKAGKLGGQPRRDFVRTHSFCQRLVHERFH